MNCYKLILFIMYILVACIFLGLELVNIFKPKDGKIDVFKIFALIIIFTVISGFVKYMLNTLL